MPSFDLPSRAIDVRKNPETVDVLELGKKAKETLKKLGYDFSGERRRLPILFLSTGEGEKADSKPTSQDQTPRQRVGFFEFAAEFRELQEAMAKRQLTFQEVLRFSHLSYMQDASALKMQKFDKRKELDSTPEEKKPEVLKDLLAMTVADVQEAERMADMRKTLVPFDEAMFVDFLVSLIHYCDYHAKYPGIKRTDEMKLWEKKAKDALGAVDGYLPIYAQVLDAAIVTKLKKSNDVKVTQERVTDAQAETLKALREVAGTPEMRDGKSVMVLKFLDKSVLLDEMLFSDERKEDLQLVLAVLIHIPRMATGAGVPYAIEDLKDDPDIQKALTPKGLRDWLAKRTAEAIIRWKAPIPGVPRKVEGAKVRPTKALYGKLLNEHLIMLTKDGFPIFEKDDDEQRTAVKVARLKEIANALDALCAHHEDSVGYSLSFTMDITNLLLLAGKRGAYVNLDPEQAGVTSDLIKRQRGIIPGEIQKALVVEQPRANIQGLQTYLQEIHNDFAERLKQVEGVEKSVDSFMNLKIVKFREFLNDLTAKIVAGVYKIWPATLVAKAFPGVNPAADLAQLESYVASLEARVAEVKANLTRQRVLLQQSVKSAQIQLARFEPLLKRRETLLNEYFPMVEKWEKMTPDQQLSDEGKALKKRAEALQESLLTLEIGDQGGKGESFASIGAEARNLVLGVGRDVVLNTRNAMAIQEDAQAKDNYYAHRDRVHWYHALPGLFVLDQLYLGGMGQRYIFGVPVSRVGRGIQRLQKWTPGIGPVGRIARGFEWTSGKLMEKTGWALENVNPANQFWKRVIRVFGDAKTAREATSTEALLTNAKTSPERLAIAQTLLKNADVTKTPAFGVAIEQVHRHRLAEFSRATQDIERLTGELASTSPKDATRIQQQLHEAQKLRKSIVIEKARMLRDPRQVGIQLSRGDANLLVRRGICGCGIGEITKLLGPEELAMLELEGSLADAAKGSRAFELSSTIDWQRMAKQMDVGADAQKIIARVEARLQEGVRSGKLMRGDLAAIRECEGAQKALLSGAKKGEESLEHALRLAIRARNLRIVMNTGAVAGDVLIIVMGYLEFVENGHKLEAARGTGNEELQKVLRNARVINIAEMGIGGVGLTFQIGATIYSLVAITDGLLMSLAAPASSVVLPVTVAALGATHLVKKGIEVQEKWDEGVADMVGRYTDSALLAEIRLHPPGEHGFWQHYSNERGDVTFSGSIAESQAGRGVRRLVQGAQRQDEHEKAKESAIERNNRERASRLLLAYLIRTSGISLEQGEDAVAYAKRLLYDPRIRLAYDYLVMRNLDVPRAEDIRRSRLYAELSQKSSDIRKRRQGEERNESLSDELFAFTTAGGKTFEVDLATFNALPARDGAMNRFLLVQAYESRLLELKALGVDEARAAAQSSPPPNVRRELERRVQFSLLKDCSDDVKSLDGLLIDLGEKDGYVLGGLLDVGTAPNQWDGPRQEVRRQLLRAVRDEASRLLGSSSTLTLEQYENAVARVRGIVQTAQREMTNGGQEADRWRRGVNYGFGPAARRQLLDPSSLAGDLDLTETPESRYAQKYPYDQGKRYLDSLVERKILKLVPAVSPAGRSLQNVNVYNFDQNWSLDGTASCYIFFANNRWRVSPNPLLEEQMDVQEADRGSASNRGHDLKTILSTLGVLNAMRDRKSDAVVSSDVLYLTSEHRDRPEIVSDWKDRTVVLLAYHNQAPMLNVDLPGEFQVMIYDRSNPPRLLEGPSVSDGVHFKREDSRIGRLVFFRRGANVQRNLPLATISVVYELPRDLRGVQTTRESPQ